ncbi:MAG: aconitate hydratase AcnA [Acidobacteria bacterium]|nr:aconitate hydratase AcnA [Acidobacteriota bacterium]
MSRNSFSTRSTLKVNGQSYDYHSLRKLDDAGGVSRLPASLRVLLENMLRHEDGVLVKREDIEALIRWDPHARAGKEILYMPARVLLQDFTGVPAVCDLAAMRDAMARLGGDPRKINPLQPADLVIDHSVQVDEFGSAHAFSENSRMEFERNRERYVFLKWGQTAFHNFRVVPPETGIVHQVNLEYLAHVAFTRAIDGLNWVYPDTLVGTDSHTTMINGLGVVGWGVGGIEAEAVMLGRPISMLIPEVVGVKLTGQIRPGVTATDLVLTVTQMLRKLGVVDKFVEFYGPGLASLSLADRATIANMSPEYGATIGFFPVDEQTIEYLRFSGRPEDLVRLVEAYYKEQGLFRTSADPDPEFSTTVSLDVSTVRPSLAGPKRPQDRIDLPETKRSIRKALAAAFEEQIKDVDQDTLARWLDGRNGAAGGGLPAVLTTSVAVDGERGRFDLKHGAVVIAAITSCTNTSNPAVLVAAGLVAQEAVKRGLSSKPWVKTSLAPGSKVVTDYLRSADLMAPLEKLGFNLVGYGCTTCIGNSGPLPPSVSKAVTDANLTVAGVLSGNRNFEGRIHAQVRANYLASPPLVVAFAIAGTMDIDLEHDPLGYDPAGKPVHLRDIWPSPEQVQAVIRKSLSSEQFRSRYADVFAGDENWRSIPEITGERYQWDEQSTYIKEPPFFTDLSAQPAGFSDILGARALAILGDSVTTDHISPAGAIKGDGPAGRYLIAKGVKPSEFNSYGARRGNHEVMMRGTFANIRLRNRMVPGVEGGVTRHLPEGEQLSIYDAAIRYRDEGVPLIILAGREYGSGSSRDWAAKGTKLLGVRAVIAQSYERIHRSNLVGMGLLPLQFVEGESAESLGLTGDEVFDIPGIASGVKPGQTLTVEATAASGKKTAFKAIVRINTPDEVEYYRHGGILSYVVRELAK